MGTRGFISRKVSGHIECLIGTRTLRHRQSLTRSACKLRSELSADHDGLTNEVACQRHDLSTVGETSPRKQAPAALAESPADRDWRASTAA